MSASKGTLCVIGLGYIGLPTAVIFAKNGWRVKGVDVSDRTIEYVTAGRLPFVEDGLGEVLAEVVENGSLTVQKDTPKADIYIISVPTPFKGDYEADLSYIDAATEAIIPRLEGGELIVLESTSPPKATEHIAHMVLEARPDLSLDGSQDRPKVFFAHAPERVLPGRIMIELVANDRIIGGLNEGAAERAKEVYETFCDGTIHLTDATTAEMAKLTENSFRDVNIAFANELSLIADNLDIDVWELIDLANKHPRVNILQPGPGVGGHCIAVDPWFIVSSDRENSRLIRTAREVNDAKPNFVLDKVHSAVTHSDNKAVAALGLAFKANIDDLRESPAVEIALQLAEDPTVEKIYVVEPNISALPPKLADNTKLELLPLKDALANSGVAVLLVDHDQFKSLTIDDLQGTTLIDTRGLLRKI